MTLIFNIEYRTSWGEEVRVLGSIPRKIEESMVIWVFSTVIV